VNLEDRGRGAIVSHGVPVYLSVHADGTELYCSMYRGKCLKSQRLMHNTVPLTVTAVAVCVTDRAGVQARPQSKPACTDFDIWQPYAALVCCLMISTLVSHVLTWITSHLLTAWGWKAELAWLADSLPTKVVTCQPCMKNLHLLVHEKLTFAGSSMFCLQSKAERFIVDVVSG